MADRPGNKLPSPLTVGIGIVGAGVEQARKLPERVTELPATLFVRTLSAVSAARREYDALADRGEETVGRLKSLVGLDGGAQAGNGAAVARIVDPFELPAALVDEVSERVPGAELTHDELPLEDYDHLTLGQLRSRLRRLDVAQLTQLRDYERAHADRLPIVTLFDNRLARLAADAAEAVAAPAE